MSERKAVAQVANGYRKASKKEKGRILDELELTPVQRENDQEPRLTVSRELGH